MTLISVFPPGLVLQTILVRGGAFKARYEYSDEGERMRFFFVANSDPVSSETIFLLTATTQTDKRLKKHGARAKLVVVDLPKMDYPSIDVDSVIDCDCKIIRRPREIFELHSRSQKYHPLPRLLGTILSWVHSAIASARTLSANDKRLILGPEPDGNGNDVEP